tara:strand:+ start:6915 stop:7133 length:219 start_codon:yes stop_codon:yes gene_type:complete
MIKKSVYAKSRKERRPELIGKKIKYNHRREGTIRGIIVETDVDTYVMASDMDPCIRWRLHYDTLENGVAEYL